MAGNEIQSTAVPSACETGKTVFRRKEKMTATLQKQKTGTWSSIFPNEQVTEQQSALFVKKLLAVGISNITYLRTIFPEHAFGDRCLEDLNLKILRDDSTVKGCFDALDKKYLRMITIGIYKDPGDSNTVVESYTFKFSYNTNEGVTIYRNEDQIASAHSPAETRKATIKLLRTIVVLTQTLTPLPDDVMMTMKLLYYDDVTPQDYEPPGFQPTTSDDFTFKEEAMNIRVGDVSTFEMCDEQLEDSQIALPSAQSSPQPQMIDTGNAVGRANEPMESSEVNQVNHNTQKMGPTTLAHNEDDQFEVRCPCGCNEDDGLMVLCGLCKTWQHAVCFALLHEDQVPELHVCDQCAQLEGEGGQPCTDSFLQFLSPIALQATCTWRRALLACTEVSRLVTPTFAKRLGVEMNVAQGLVNRLEREGFVRPPGKGKSNKQGRVVNKDKILGEGMKKYFDKGKSKNHLNTNIANTEENDSQMPDEQVESITKKASVMDISGKKFKTSTVAVDKTITQPSTVPAQDKGGAATAQSSKKDHQPLAVVQEKTGCCPTLTNQQTVAEKPTAPVPNTDKKIPTTTSCPCC
ncbi:hypothetical protein EMCRGX_G009027 [Ephydatia muelleri]